MAREHGQTVGESGHEGRAVLLMDHHVVHEAEDASQEELEEEAAGNALVVALSTKEEIEKS